MNEEKLQEHLENTVRKSFYEMGSCPCALIWSFDMPLGLKLNDMLYYDSDRQQYQISGIGGIPSIESGMDDEFCILIVFQNGKTEPVKRKDVLQ